MKLFEPISVGIFGLRIHWVALFLPLALILGWAGVVTLSIACGLAHFFLPDSLGPIDAFGAAFSVLLSTSIAYYFILHYKRPEKLFLATLIITILFSVFVGSYNSFFVDFDLITSIFNVFRNVWIPIAIIGYLIAETLNYYINKYKIDLKVWG